MTTSTQQAPATHRVVRINNPLGTLEVVSWHTSSADAREAADNYAAGFARAAGGTVTGAAGAPAKVLYGGRVVTTYRVEGLFQGQWL